MEMFIPIIAILCTFGVGPAVIYLRNRHRIEERKLELEAKTGGSNQETKRLTEENKLLRERVENLESIVCSVDFELNQKLAKVIDEQRSLILPAGAGVNADSPSPVPRRTPTNSGRPSSSPGSGSGPAVAAGPALERTATA